jgi:hypothetical protein
MNFFSNNGSINWIFFFFFVIITFVKQQMRLYLAFGHT